MIGHETFPVTSLLVALIGNDSMQQRLQPCRHEMDLEEHQSEKFAGDAGAWSRGKRGDRPAGPSVATSTVTSSRTSLNSTATQAEARHPSRAPW